MAALLFLGMLFIFKELVTWVRLLLISLMTGAGVGLGFWFSNELVKKVFKK